MNSDNANRIEDAIARMEMVDWAMALVLREKTEAERLAIGWGMWRSARSMLTNLVAAENPDWPASAVAREVARRLAHGGS